MTQQDKPAPERQPIGGREGIYTGETVKLTAEQEAARKRRNLAIGLSLLGFCALVFIVTVVRLGQNFAQGAAS